MKSLEPKAIVANPNSLEKPLKPYELEVDWMALVDNRLWTQGRGLLQYEP